MKPTEAPALEGWVTASEVAGELGVSRQTANKMINRGDFATLHTLGKRSMYVVREEEVERVKEARAGTSEEADAEPVG